MKRELDTSKGSFKFDLVETANADPVLTPADFKVLCAYVSVMAWPSCRSWLATSLAQAKTGLSDRQFRESRKKLLGQNDEKRAYMFPVRRSGKVSAYQLVNPWRDEARDLIASRLAYHQDAERKRKADQREVASRKNLPGQNDGCPGKICRSVPEKSAAYYPSTSTPREEEGREEGPLSSNIVHLIDRQRRQA